MARKISAVIADMLEAIDGIERAVGRKTFDEFKSDWLLRHGVQRGIEIISEAARHLPDEAIADSPDVPWAEIKGMGNVLRHEYHRVSDRIIWNVIGAHLPRLKAALSNMRDRGA